MLEIKKYHRYMQEIVKPFAGQPYGSLLLIQLLITKADTESGVINNISYREIANLLIINPAPGRKNSGIPSKQTIRNYIKSIEKECAKYFKVISEGQTLKFLFPELPKIFIQIFENKKVNTVVDPTNPHEEIDGNVVFDDEVNIEINTELNTPTRNVEKLFININNKNNNNNLGETLESKNSKQQISPNFYPSEKTIARAIASGYSFVIDNDIIQEFIDKNTAWGSEFADFNPVYLSFLAKHEHFQQQRYALKNIQGQSRRATDERTFIKWGATSNGMKRYFKAKIDII